MSRKRGLAEVGASTGSGASGRHFVILVTQSESQGSEVRCTLAAKAWTKAGVAVDVRQKEVGDALWWGRLDDISCVCGSISAMEVYINF